MIKSGVLSKLLATTVKSVRTFFNSCKGLVFIQNYHISDISSFTSGIDEQCRVKEVEEATWVKPRRETTQVLLISFKSDKLTEFIRIPGEAERTRVYEYKDKPMMCRKCCKYGHTDKRCFSSVVVCGKCAEPGHRSDGRDSEIVKCSSCSGAHTSGHNTCTDKNTGNTK